MEQKTMAFSTRKYANFGATASQIGESYYIVMREITNVQLSLEDAAKRLASKVLSVIKDIDLDEAASIRDYPRLAQGKVFRLL